MTTVLIVAYLVYDTISSTIARIQGSIKEYLRARADVRQRQEWDHKMQERAAKRVLRQQEYNAMRLKYNLPIKDYND